MKIFKGILWMLVTIFASPIAAENCPAVHLGKITIRQFRVSAYCPCRICCGKDACGVTASGHSIKPGEQFAAADKSIPFGTILDIPGYGRQMPVLDRGGAINGNCLDVFFDSHKKALNWGVQFLDVAIYE